MNERTNERTQTKQCHLMCYRNHCHIIIIALSRTVHVKLRGADQGHRELSSGIPANSWKYSFRKIPTRIPGIVFSSLNLDYLHTNFMVKNLNYALNAKQWYFVI